MTLYQFLRDKVIYLTCNLLSIGIGIFIMYTFHIPIVIILFFILIIWGGTLFGLIFEYYKKYKFYQLLIELTESLEETYYISSMIEPPSFIEGEILTHTLAQASKAMNDKIASNQQANKEYREYVELWVHEIKTPIAAAKLLCENHNLVDIQEQLKNIEGFVEQALFYARVSSLNKDYLIKPIDLNNLIRDYLKLNARDFIARGVRIHLEVEGIVNSDPKWLTFVIKQIVDNSIKYGATSIEFYFDQSTLRITDNGIGIPSQDLSRVFERSFTGENGRTHGQSTGMGLYLCKELCTKMGLKIEVESGKGTSVSIHFPKNALFNE